MAAMTDLDAIIRDEIEKRGAISFRRFMDLALYHPKLGYYRNGVDPFGARGDFFTAAQLQPVFGEAVAKFASRFANQVLELGAGRQELRAALNDYAYQAFDWNTESLPETFSGLVIANEFFDAQPAHLLGKRLSGWIEILVTIKEGLLIFEDGQMVSGALLDYAERYGALTPVDGFLEVNLEIDVWMSRLAQMISDGLLLLIDYGYSAKELARFPQGTMLAYRKHRVNADLLSNPGSRDLTAHVNFTHLCECAMQKGFKVEEECSLASWLMNLWSPEEFETKWKEASDGWRLQWKQLVFGMGETFRVLLLQKSL